MHTGKNFAINKTYLDNTVYIKTFTYIFKYGVNYSINFIFSNKNLSELVLFMDHKNITMDPQIAMFCLWSPSPCGPRLRNPALNNTN